MSYASAEDLRGRLGTAVFGEIYDEICDESRSSPPGEAGATSRSGTLPPGALADLAAASAEIDGAIAARYALPVTGARSLALLRDWCLTLAEERAYARAAGSAWAEKVKTRVEQVRKYLEEIRLDRFRLPDAAENGGADGGTIALVQGDRPIFSREKMGGV